MGWNSTFEIWEWISNFIPHFIKDVITYPCWDIRTLHGCPSQMNDNLMFSNLSSFVGDNIAGCMLYNGKDNHWQINWLIQIMRNVRVMAWGLLNLRSLISPWAKFSIPPKYLLDSLHRIHIRQVSPQLSCGDTCQIWMWYSIANLFLGDADKIGK